MTRKLKALLDLGRVANLPTVWTNCIAGWLLAGAGFEWSERMGFKELAIYIGPIAHKLAMPLMFIPMAAASLLYVAGTTLNDAFDAKFDREHRPDRPIPSGVFTEKAVWSMGLITLALGAIIFLYIGVTSASASVIALCVTLLVLILVYDWMHKKSVWASLPMGGCRFVLYALVAVSAVQVTRIEELSKAQLFTEMDMEEINRAATLTGLQVFNVGVLGIAMLVYIMVLTLTARAESGTEELRVPKAVRFLLFLPILACGTILCLNKPEGVQALITLGFACAFAVWTSSAVSLLAKQERGKARIGIAVGRLLAGICLIDGMAAAAVSVNPVPIIWCAALFLVCLLLQRYVPAT